MTDTLALETIRLGELAGCDQWKADEDCVEFADEAAGGVAVAHTDPEGLLGNPFELAKFIAHANPANMTALAQQVLALRTALSECRTSICGYALQNDDDAYRTVEAFHKELRRIDAIARTALTQPSEAVGEG